MKLPYRNTHVSIAILNEYYSSIKDQKKALKALVFNCTARLKVKTLSFTKIPC